jgi:hypothetical protein
MMKASITWRIRRGKEHEIPLDAVLTFQDAISIVRIWVSGGRYYRDYFSTLSDRRHRALNGCIGEIAGAFPCRASWRVGKKRAQDIPLAAMVNIVVPEKGCVAGRHVVSLSDSRLFSTRFIKRRRNKTCPTK